jgi:hypothetical protein
LLWVDAGASRPAFHDKEIFMGKYFLGWLLGIPLVVLVALWFFVG